MQRRGVLLRVDITKMKLRDVLSDKLCHSLVISLIRQFFKKRKKLFDRYY